MRYICSVGIALSSCDEERAITSDMKRMRTGNIRNCALPMIAEFILRSSESIRRMSFRSFLSLDKRCTFLIHLVALGLSV